MAPSNVFSYFRPHHRRNNSNPASPDTTQPSVSLPSSHPQSIGLHPTSRTDHDSHFPHMQTPLPSLPPVLPPIPRIASTYGPPNGYVAPRSEDGFDRNNPLGIEIDAAASRQFGYSRDVFIVRDGVTSPQQDKPLPSRPFTAQSAVQAGRESPGDQAGQPLQASRPPTRPPNTSYLSQQSHSSASDMKERQYYSPGPSPIEFSAAFRQPIQDSAHPPKPIKSRLNILNSMSHLIRRRSSQTLEVSTQDLSSNTRLQGVPEGYDPSIRGNKVHDFSAPRPQQVVEIRESSNPSPPKRERAHTPVFVENFDEDIQPQEVDRAMRAEQLVNQAFLNRVSLPQPPPAPARTPPLVPVMDDPTLHQIPTRKSLSISTEALIISPVDSRLLSPVLEGELRYPEAEGFKQEDVATPRKSSSITRSRATSNSDTNFQPGAVPKHMTSKSSRFSFQINGGDSAAQEKLLEERHKQKAAAKAITDESPTDEQVDEQLDDDFDEDAMYDEMMNDEYDDGFGEEIPSLGGGLYSSGLHGSARLAVEGLSSFDVNATQSPSTNSLDPAAVTPNLLKTPVDAAGNAIGKALSEAIATTNAGAAVTGSIQSQVAAIGVEQDITEHNVNGNEGAYPLDQVASPPRIGTGTGADDLYFDDGMIDDFEGDTDETFDESVFDDPNHPLYERKPVSTLAPKPSIRDPVMSETAEDASTGDIYTNLNAYHGALASAAQKAEADGRFVRHDSADEVSTVDVASPTLSQSDVTSSSRPSLVPDDGRYSSSSIPPFSPNDYNANDRFPVADDDYGYDDFDPDMDDEAMVAAANAEALANDYDGTYGRDFGFYANPALQGESVAFNGGYFGTPEQMLGRSTSGRNAVREPNLTPITERSEYSTRNSFIGNQFGFPSSGSIQSPGLAQLARLSPWGFDEDPDMSMEKLIKARKQAFSENRSLKSSSSSPRDSVSGDSGLRRISFMSSGLDGTEEYPRHPLDSEEEHDLYDDEIAAANQVEDEHLSIISRPLSSHQQTFLHDSMENSPPESASPSLHGSPTITHFNPSYQSTPIAKPPLLAPLADHSLPPPTSQLNMLNLTTKPSLQPPIDLGLPSFTAQSSGTTSPLSPYISMHPHPPFSATLDQQHHITSPPATSFTFPTRPQISHPQKYATASNTSPVAPPKRHSWQTHSRKSSAADSVTYVRERDEQGEARWVLERRRTAETGEVEILGREVVEGGRI